MRRQLTVAAKDVRVGDRVYNSLATHMPWKWIAVKAVESRDGAVVITTTYWETHKHPEEGVEVQREEP